MGRKGDSAESYRSVASVHAAEHEIKPLEILLGARVQLTRADLGQGSQQRTNAEAEVSEKRMKEETEEDR